MMKSNHISLGRGPVNLKLFKARTKLARLRHKLDNTLTLNLLILKTKNIFTTSLRCHRNRKRLLWKVSLSSKDEVTS